MTQTPTETQKQLALEQVKHASTKLQLEQIIGWNVQLRSQLTGEVYDRKRLQKRVAELEQQLAVVIKGLRDQVAVLLEGSQKLHAQIAVLNEGLLATDYPEKKGP